jgi:hypothetical protein
MDATFTNVYVANVVGHLPHPDKGQILERNEIAD